jgi:hypothetical protein
MKKRSSAKKPPRNWVVTIVAGTTTLLTAVLAVLTFAPNPIAVIISITFGLVALLAAIITVQGRRGTLRELFSAILLITLH